VIGVETLMGEGKLTGSEQHSRAWIGETLWMGELYATSLGTLEYPGILKYVYIEVRRDDLKVYRGVKSQMELEGKNHDLLATPWL
jgi:hypothetical protein